MMDAGSLGGQVQDWVMQHFQGRGPISKERLVEEARRSSLPPEAKDAIEELPRRSWSPASAVHDIVDVLETRSGGGARGEGNVPGRGGYGRSN